MAGLDANAIAALLLGGPSEAAATAANPYIPFQNVANQTGDIITQLTTQAPGKFSTRDLIIGALGSGLAGGVLGNLKDSYASKVNDRYLNAVSGMAGLNEMLGLPAQDSAITQESSGLTPSLFSEAQNKASLWKGINAIQDAQAQQESTIEAKKIQETARVDIIKKAVELGNITPDQGLKLIQNITGVTAGLPAIAESETLTDAAMKLPKDIRTEGIKEVGVIREKEKAAQFVESQFEQAKKIPSLAGKQGLGSLFPASTSSNEMDGITNSLTTFIQQFLGREMSQVERTNFTKLLPDWNDTVDQIEKKKTRFIDLMNTFAKSTPILQDRGIISNESNVSTDSGVTQPTPPTGYEFTGKIDSQGRRGIRPISRAQIG